MENSTSEINIEDIRKVSGYDNLSDEELQQMVEDIKELTLIIMLINEKNFSK